MRKWEEKYQQLNAGELDTKLAELREKADKKMLTRDEYKEYETLKRVKENMPKIANVLEYKEKLQEQLKEINEEIATRKENMKAEQDKQKLEEELKDILSSKAMYEKQLKNKELTDEERSKLEEKLEKCKNDYKENNDKFSELLQEESKKSKGINQLSKLSEEELENKKFEISTKVSKCNMICNNLLQGKSWDYIDMRLEKWEDKKFTSDKETADKMRRSTTKTKQAERNYDEDIEKFVILPDGKEAEINYESDEQIKSEVLPVEVSKFAEKHPKLAALGNKIKAFWNKLSQKNEEKDEEKDEEKNPEPKKENKKDDKEDFRNYIKEIAEKGYENVKEEKQNEKRKPYKEAAYKREAEKYGEEYAKKSYNPVEKEGR